MDLEQQVLAAAQTADTTQLFELIQSTKTDDLLWCLEKRLTTDVGAEEYLRALFQGWTQS
jgi:hypothetical protein